MKPTTSGIPKFAFQLEANERLNVTTGDQVLASKKIRIPHVDGSSSKVTLFMRVPAKDLVQRRAANQIDSAEKTAKAVEKLLKARGLSALQVHAVMNMARKEALNEAKVVPMLHAIHAQTMNPDTTFVAQSHHAPSTKSAPSVNQAVHNPIKHLQEKYLNAPDTISASLFAHSFADAMASGKMMRMTEAAISHLESAAKPAQPQALKPQGKKPLPVPPPRPLKSGAGKPLPPIPQPKASATDTGSTAASTSQLPTAQTPDPTKKRDQ